MNKNHKILLCVCSAIGMVISLASCLYLFDAADALKSGAGSTLASLAPPLNLPACSTKTLPQTGTAPRLVKYGIVLVASLIFLGVVIGILFYSFTSFTKVSTPESETVVVVDPETISSGLTLKNALVSVGMLILVIVVAFFFMRCCCRRQLDNPAYNSQPITIPVEPSWSDLPILLESVNHSVSFLKPKYTGTLPPADTPYVPIFGFDSTRRIFLDSPAQKTTISSSETDMTEISVANLIVPYFGQFFVPGFIVQMSDPDSFRINSEDYLFIPLVRNSFENIPPASRKKVLGALIQLTRNLHDRVNAMKRTFCADSFPAVRANIRHLIHDIKNKVDALRLRGRINLRGDVRSRMSVNFVGTPLRSMLKYYPSATVTENNVHMLLRRKHDKPLPFKFLLVLKDCGDAIIDSSPVGERKLSALFIENEEDLEFALPDQMIDGREHILPAFESALQALLARLEQM